MTYRIYTVKYNGEPYFASRVFKLTDNQKRLASSYSQNLSILLNDGMYQVLSSNDFSSFNESYEGVVFTDAGLYMAREFETGWQQIYFLSYDGKTFRRLTDGPNWGISIVRVDEKNGVVYYTAKRDATVRQALYKVDSKGVITALTDPAYNAAGVRFSPDGKYFVHTGNIHP